MDFQRISRKNLKYILGSKLLEEKCGQKCIRLMFEEYEKSGNIRFNREIVHKFYEQLKGERIEIIPEWSDFYPDSLKDLDDSPMIIFTKGDKKLLKRRSLCIVGTRKNTYYGGRILALLMRKIASTELSKDLVTVSGLAYGIDKKVHALSLDHSIRTVAVVAGGIDKGFPRRNLALHDRIVSEGLVISEFPPGTEIIKGMFPLRNRLMAALSEATLVIEAPVQSGSLITATIAAELGRDVYSFPGDIFRTNSGGTNKLISEGAIPIINSLDIEAFLNNL